MTAHAVEALATCRVERYHYLSKVSMAEQCIVVATQFIASLVLCPPTSHSPLTYLVANVELLYRIALLYDLANEFMPANEVGRALEVASVKVQVAAAERCGGHFEDRIRGFLDDRNGPVFNRDLMNVTPPALSPNCPGKK